MQPMQAGTLYAQMPIIRPFHFDAHRAKCGDGGEHVRTLQQPLYFGDAFGKRAKNNGTMGNGFVAGDRKTTLERPTEM